jgi:hypothetical protein
MMKTGQQKLLIPAVGFPPPVTYITKNEEGHGSQVNNAGIQGLGRFLTQLLGRFCAYRTLRICICCKKPCEENETGDDYKKPLYHVPRNLHKGSGYWPN